MFQCSTHHCSPSVTHKILIVCAKAHTLVTAPMSPRTRRPLRRARDGGRQTGPLARCLTRPESCLALPPRLRPAPYLPGPHLPSPHALRVRSARTSRAARFGSLSYAFSCHDWYIYVVCGQSDNHLTSSFGQVSHWYRRLRNLGMLGAGVRVRRKSTCNFSDSHCRRSTKAHNLI